MSADNPLSVQFTLPDENLARHLDLLIARAGGDPDRWLADLITEKMQIAAATRPRRLDALAETVSALANPQGAQAITAPLPAGGIPPRPAHARAPQPSSAWRSR